MDLDVADSQEQEEKERGAREYLLLGFVALALVFLPPLSGLNGWPVLALLAVLVFALSFVDGLTFRKSLTWVIVVGITYFVTTKMYYNDGAWIYAFPLALIAWGGAALGDKF